MQKLSHPEGHGEGHNIDRKKVFEKQNEAFRQLLKDQLKKRMTQKDWGDLGNLIKQQAERFGLKIIRDTDEAKKTVNVFYVFDGPDKEHKSPDVYSEYYAVVEGDEVCEHRTISVFGKDGSLRQIYDLDGDWKLERTANFRSQPDGKTEMTVVDYMTEGRPDKSTEVFD